MSELRNGLLVATLITATLLAQVPAAWPLGGTEIAILAVIAVAGAAAAYGRHPVLATLVGGASVFVVTGLNVGFTRASLMDGIGVTGNGLDYAPMTRPRRWRSPCCSSGSSGRLGRSPLWCAWRR